MTTSEIKTALFTPRHAVTDKRTNMKISEADRMCFKGLKKNQWGSFHDYATHTNYLVRKASCGLGCFCDAVYKEI